MSGGAQVSAQRMRLLRCISSVNPRFGGPIEGIIQIAPALAELGCHCELLALDESSDPWVKECPIRTEAVGSRLGRYRYSPELVRWLRRNHQRFDAVSIHGLWNYCSLGVWRALRRTNRPYFVFPHGMLDPWFKHRYPFKHLKKWFYWPWAEYRVLRDARAVLFTCEEERRLARQSFWLYRCREAVVNYGTAAPPDRTEAQRLLFYERFPALRSRRMVLFLGRIHPKKGCDLLIKAFARVALSTGNRGRFQLVMAGPDQVGWQPELQSLARSLSIADSLTWTGMLSGDLKWGAYRAAEVFALLSHQENFGIAVVEALACGVPVLISRSVNIWREIETDGAGLVAQDSLAGSPDTLQRWVELSQTERTRMANNARRCFLRRFEAHRAARSLIETIDRFTRRPEELATIPLTS